jgi:hypothetical protein
MMENEKIIKEEPKQTGMSIRELQNKVKMMR